MQCLVPENFFTIIQSQLPPHLCLLFKRRFSLLCSLFARCYWGNHNCFLFLPVLRCFNSRRTLASRHERVVTLGDPEFNARLQLTQAYRSLPRPSSQSKPSYPSNSLSNQNIKVLRPSINKLKVVNYQFRISLVILTFILSEIFIAFLACFIEYFSA